LEITVEVDNNTVKRSINFGKISERTVNVVNNIFISYNRLVLKDKLSIAEEISIERLLFNVINRAYV